MSQNATLSGLIRLQEIDHEVLRIERRLQEGPALVERRGEKFVRGEQRAKEAHDRVQAAKAKVAELELDLKSKEGDIQKAASQQLQARTNSEYKALGDHMDRLRQHCSDLEDRILAAFEAVEAEQAAEKDVKEQLEELRTEKQSFEEQWKTDQVEYEKELEGVRARRDQLATSLPKGSLMVYERVLRARGGQAVVPVEVQVCGGCRMKVTPNDLARLRGGSDLVTCKSCERILYLPQVHDAAS